MNGTKSQVDRILRGLPREEPTGILAEAERKIRESQAGWRPVYFVPPPDDKVTFSNSPPAAYSVDPELAAEVSEQGTPILPAPMWPRDWDDTSRIRYMGPKTIRETIYGPEERKMPTTDVEGKVWPSQTAAGLIEHRGGWKYEARTRRIIVGEGDTLWGVARDLTGSGANYKLIFAREFWETIIRPGQKIPLNMVQGIYRAWTKEIWEAVVTDMTWEEFLARGKPAASERQATTPRDEMGAEATGLPRIPKMFKGHTQDQERAWLNALAAHAQKAKEDTAHRVFVSVQLAQAILESSWGTRAIFTHAYNIGGIKGRGDAGSVHFRTPEYTKTGQQIFIVAKFAQHSSPYEGLKAHGLMISRAQRYAGAAQAKTPEDQIREIAKAGYATDPRYAEKLINILYEQKLKLYDK
jgi:flagellum-specific peptidoglycan hydrolase FlgJ